MSLYHQHLQTLVARHNDACDQFQLNSIVLHSGSLTYYAGDDNSHPFRALPAAQQWLPYNLPPETWIVFSKETGLSLYWPAKQDFWHVMPVEPQGDWTKDWRVIAAKDASWLKQLEGNVALFSNQVNPSSLPDHIQLNPEPLMKWLDYDRAYKTEWEIENTRLANQIAAQGHFAAQEAFLTGLSEYDIHMAYLRATDQQQIDEPYGSIVALNEAAAVLHYENKRIEPLHPALTLLIDAGAKVNGYASDITRTFTAPGTLFDQLRQEVEIYQKRLVAACTIGTPYPNIHDMALQFAAETLQKTGICMLSTEEQLSKKIPQAFFPHGIGHLLGLQVHDVGGFQESRLGNNIPRPEHAPFLRLMRPLDDGMIVTIEPGLYFIPMLLENLVASTPDHGCDLKLINELKPYGGIRIEDNVVIRKEGPINLTRSSFAEIGRTIE
ncbi:Xaa-Pro dipeptidase [Reinekea sp. G2M2-21]|uniref:Xaa-Pro dipeptidase n=1 Tax=Reinekea sp. G2M2-21 TaxID=2788942 RepID=UPI0018AB68C8|nr:Xaa-Pro dipeptidase [Reinekea sp. G2M2-21]